jgi:benzoyl-CoA reductase subunit BamB
VAAIGLAGENRVFFASIEQGRSSASRGGIGAVMGDKGSRPLSVRGTKDVHLARPPSSWKSATKCWITSSSGNDNPIPGVMPILAGLGSPQEMKIHDEKWHTENFAWGNSRDRSKDFWNEGDRAADWTETLDTMRTDG